jgi:hypothetical protein
MKITLSLVGDAGRPPAPPRRRDGDRRRPSPGRRVGREGREGRRRLREPRGLRGGVEAGERGGRGGGGHGAEVAASRRRVVCSGRGMASGKTVCD